MNMKRKLILKRKKIHKIISTVLAFTITGGLLIGCERDNGTDPNTITESVIDEPQIVVDSSNIDCAYMINGELYIRGDYNDDFSVVQILDAFGNAANIEYTDVEAQPDSFTVAGFKKYNLYATTNLEHFKGRDKIAFPDGRYELKFKDKNWPVVSVSNYAQDSGLKTDKGDKLDFCDYYYPIVYNASEYDNIEIFCNSTTESKDPSKWPKILQDGNLETLPDGSEIQITYPKKTNTDEPKIYRSVSLVNADGLYSLDHMDKLTIVIDGNRTDVYYWDQIAKVWFKDTTSKQGIDMVYVDGGTYTAGDWRDENSPEYRYTIAYIEGKTTQNILRMWNNILDPQFMGEDKVGADAIGVSGLYEENSLALNENCPMWKLNDASKDLHQVTVSDFWMGKYEVTMEQYYTFIDACRVKSKDPAVVSYIINDSEYFLDDVSAYQVMFKKETAKDNGWGKGSRPAIDISWYEAVQFCNFYSLKQGLEPCYTFVNIYNGEEGDGKTKCNYLSGVFGSDMQKGDKSSGEFQLVRVECDFEKNGYRLPTEAEYEYAARGGKYLKDVNNGNGSLFAGLSTSTTTENPADYTDGFHDLIGYYAWVNISTDNPKKNGEYTSSLNTEGAGGNAYSGPVGTKFPNSLGIHDLVGNVWEQQWDYYNRAYYGLLAENSENIDPRGPEYTTEQISIFGNYPVDSSVNDEYTYSYKADEEGNGMLRGGAISIKYSGKVSHTLRGGSFSNPIGLANTINRFGPTQSYSMSSMNFTDARIGFRVARSVVGEEKNLRLTDSKKETELCEFADTFLYRINAPKIRLEYMDMIWFMLEDGAQITFNQESMDYNKFFEDNPVPDTRAVVIGNHIVSANNDGSYNVVITEYIYDKDEESKNESTIVYSNISISENETGDYKIKEVVSKTLNKNNGMSDEKYGSEEKQGMEYKQGSEDKQELGKKQGSEKNKGAEDKQSSEE